jgi:sialic acid synthase SpsE
LKFFRDHKRVYLLHCVAEYPCPFEHLRLGNIAILKREFGSERVRIGYSGHGIGFADALAASCEGAEMIEKHFCLSRKSFAHHIDCSLEPDEFMNMTSRLARMPKWSAESYPRGDEICMSEAASRTYFGMLDHERPFLEHQTYSTEKLGYESRV